MTPPARLLDVLLVMSEDGPFTSILATTFTFDAEFFVSTGILTALAGELDRTGNGERRRRIPAEVIRDRLGNPFVGVLQGCPSQSGATPGWIDRQLWPTRRLGVLHAKCLLAVGRTSAHVLVTSANLTEGSWCRNIEVAASWPAPLAATTAATRRNASAIAKVADGMAQLAGLAGAPTMQQEARGIADRLNHGEPTVPIVVWSGGRAHERGDRHFVERPLDHLSPGDRAIVISPFWAADDQSAAQVMKALAALAPAVELVGRSLPGSTVLELPLAMAAAVHDAGAQLAIARPPSSTGPPSNAQGLDDASMLRMLHAKQITVGARGRWQSYVGSANATTQGLGLSRRSNIELGVIVEAESLLCRLDATGVQSPGDPPDPDDPSALLDDTEDWAAIYARAFLESSGELHVHIEPALIDAHLEIPTGAPPRALQRTIDHVLRLDEREVDALVRRAELTLVLSTAGRLAVPVVLDETLKRRIGSDVNAADLDLDELLARLAANPLRRPTDDETDPDSDGPDPSSPKPGEQQGPPRKPVHRAREAIEVITAAERPLRAFIEGKPPERLVQLRLGGAESIVGLAHRAAASTKDTPHGMTPLAAAFVVIEIALLLGRLQDADPGGASVLKGLTDEIMPDLNDLVGKIEGEDAVVGRRLRKLLDR